VRCGEPHPLGRQHHCDVEKHVAAECDEPDAHGGARVLPREVSDARLEDFRWRIEELRVSLYAQELKTPYPVSFKRLDKLWREIAR
jgi:hypothetical protein